MLLLPPMPPMQRLEAIVAVQIVSLRIYLCPKMFDRNQQQQRAATAAHPTAAADGAAAPLLPLRLSVPPARARRRRSKCRLRSDLHPPPLPRPLNALALFAVVAGAI